MNNITKSHLAKLWTSRDATLAERYTRHLDEVNKMDIPTAGVVGRDLLLRKQNLFTPRFYLGALLATEGETGHDGFLDFTDSASILPEERYKAIISQPDLLIDDPISHQYDELGFVHAISKHFDELAGLEEHANLLEHLVFGSDPESPWPTMHASATSENAKKWLPRLFKRSGSILRS